jgi:hypothetical protein
VDVCRSKVFSKRKRSFFFGVNDAHVVAGLDEALSVEGVAVVAGVRQRLASSDISSTLKAPSKCRRAFARRLCTTSTHASRMHDMSRDAVPADCIDSSFCNTDSAVLYKIEA